MKASKAVTNTAIIVVIGTWSASLVVDMIVPAYDPPDGLQPLMMAIAGFLFATRNNVKVVDEGGGGPEVQESGEEKP